MTTLNVAVWFVVLLILAAGLAWVIALPEWRRLRAPQRLELHEFFRCQGCEELEAKLGMPATRLAELRCATCAAAEECQHRLAAGAAAPPKDCPNASLFKSAG
jgi:hypothetical protein